MATQALNLSGMMRFLKFLDSKDVPFFRIPTLRMWSGLSANSVNSAVKRFLKHGLLVRVSHGLYASALLRPYERFPSLSMMGWLRPGHCSYVGYETILSRAGVISQIPFVLTCATTGGTGREDTPYGTFDFTHVGAGNADIVWNDERGHWEATVPQALKDLQKANRCLDLVDMEAYNEIMREL